MKMPATYSALLALISVGAVSAADVASPPPITTDPARAGDGVQVGVARRDGVTFAGNEAFVTRNGATERLTKELILPSGVTARPDGTVVLADKTETTLRATQILTFDGKISPLIPSPNTNPGDPRGNGTATIDRSAASASTPASPGQMAAAGGSRGGFMGSQPAASGSVFVGNDGVPFMGTLNADGTLRRADGTVLRADGSFRAVTFGADGTPTLGTVNSNGTITRTDGAIISPDGSVRSANGTLISPAPQNSLGTTNNGNTNPGVPQPNNNANPRTNNGVAAGQTSTNSPRDTGAVNPGNPNTGGQLPNNPNGILNNGAAPGTQTGGAPQGTNTGTGTNRNNSSGNSGNSGAGGRNGAVGGATSGGASGAGGASGGAAGGASR